MPNEALFTIRFADSAAYSCGDHLDEARAVLTKESGYATWIHTTAPDGAVCIECTYPEGTTMAKAVTVTLPEGIGDYLVSLAYSDLAATEAFLAKEPWNGGPESQEEEDIAKGDRDAAKAAIKLLGGPLGYLVPMDEGHEGCDHEVVCILEEEARHDADH